MVLGFTKGKLKLHKKQFSLKPFVQKWISFSAISAQKYNILRGNLHKKQFVKKQSAQKHIEQTKNSTSCSKRSVHNIFLQTICKGKAICRLSSKINLGKCERGNIICVPG